MATLTIRLPEVLKKHAEQAAAEDGITIDAIVQHAVDRELARRERKKLDLLLLERLKGPFEPVTKKDFDDIRAEIYARHPELKEKKDAGRAVARGKRRRAS